VASQLAAKGGVSRLFRHGGVESRARRKSQSAAKNYLKRLEELVPFRHASQGQSFSGRRRAPTAAAPATLDRTLADHSVTVHAMRTDRDCLFDGTGPDVSEENLAPSAQKPWSIRKPPSASQTDGDADRFGNRRQ